MIGLGLALVQHIQNRAQKLTERERLAQQSERLRTAVSGAKSASEIADLVVQRAKDPDVTIPELQNISRALRGSLDTLANQLDAERSQIQGEVVRKSSYGSRVARP